MANVIKLSKGLDLNLKGKASQQVINVKAAGKFALVPDDFHGMKPKVVVKEGDKVKAGDALFVDKNHPSVKFVSPVSGTVSLVERGERRKVLSVQVEADAEQEYTDFGVKNVAEMNGEDVKALLLESGLFAFFKKRPYDIVANPDDAPKGIFVSAFSSMPLAADFTYVLQGQEADFQAGLTALSKIAKTYLGISKAQQSVQALNSAKDVEVNVFDGPNPAGNVGVQINHVSPINKGEVVWTLGAEEVIFIGRLLNTGKVDLTRKIAFCGSEAKQTGYVSMKVGEQLSNLIATNTAVHNSTRIISGNVFTGKKVIADGFLGARSTEVTIIPEGNDVAELLGWIMPRFNEYSANRSYCSWLLGKKEYTLDARVKGGERHMIMSGEYDKVFPMDIYPEQLVKAIIAGDIDRMEALGIYEVAPEDFAVCEFVCSSKLEVQRIVREGLDMLRAEME
ncbi:MAG: Na(+)-translocating NADH-quinone reductase subunit A [Bacteroidaceae bacterium]|nr:Na(+)-translocating NADH-quinone reductase subunit A [Bacteroidaceae bacterium]